LLSSEKSALHTLYVALISERMSLSRSRIK
jgi:hypothetical protein